MTDKTHVIKEFAAAVAATLIAWAGRWLLLPVLDNHVPFITFFPMMFFLAWWGGFRATLFGVFLSTAVLAYAILQPVGSFQIALVEYRIGLVIYIMVSLAAGGLGERVLIARTIAREATANAIEEGKQLRVTMADRKRAEEALTFLANAGTSLAALADRQSALQQAARIPIPFLADWCVVYVIDEQGAIDYHAHAHEDPEKERLLADMLTKFPLDWSSNTATVQALRTGKPQLMEDMPQPLVSSFTQSDEHREMVKVLGPHGVISVPLKIRDRTIGVIGLVACDAKRRYTQRDVELAESLAERVAIAVDNAKLFYAIKEASRHKDEFLAMLAHELRNPLAAIRYAVALGQVDPADAGAEMFSIIDRQTGNLARLIDDLLDVSRISRDKVKLRQEYVDLRTIIEGAAATARPIVEEKCHELKIELLTDPIRLFVDMTRTEQILANLLTNAAKYTNKGGQITVRGSTEGKMAVIDVIDTGIGLPPEMLHRVFELFTQADRTLDRSEGGLGIGLTVARRLAELHGGTISVHSDGLGCGSTFTVRLPLSEEISSAAREQSDDEQAQAAIRRKILVVDDNRDTAMSCSMLFKTMGHDVQTAYDGIAALELARSFKPEAIFLDIGLPGMNGFEVVRTLRQEGHRNEIIVAVSGYGQPEDRQRSREAGFDEHLVKPVQQESLVLALRRIAVRQAVDAGT
jgi:signal transduction histidine kinase/ActR/RegA family two-component response regulator